MPILLASKNGKSDLAAALTSDKFPVSTCRFRECQTVLKEGNAPLILLDSDVSVTSGLKELKRFKSTWPAVPIIFVASAPSEDTIIEAFRLGARDFFKKPVNTYQLKKTISNLLRITKSSQEKRSPLISRTISVSSPYDRATSDVPDNILRVINFMEDHLGKDISLEDLSKKAGMSKFHFCRTFKKYIQFSPMQFLTNLRMEKAKSLLACSSHSVSMVAESVGFTDLSNFIKSFKKIIGITPTAYRKTSKKRK